jgi:glycosyltransferase involved in cell wall biosynthesis
MYFANVVTDASDVAERMPVCAEAGRLRVVEMLRILSESSLFDRIYLISQGRGRQRGYYAARTIDKGSHTAVYLPILSYGKFLCNLSALFTTTAWLVRHVRKQDVVVVYNCDPTITPLLLARPLLRFKLLVQYEELYRGLGLKYIPRQVVERIGAKVADGFIVSNTGIVDRLHLNLDRNRLAVASGYMPSYRSLNHEAVSKGKDAANLTLLYAGTLDEARGIKGFIQSFLRVQCQARLLITGSGPLQSYVRDIANRHKNIAYLGVLSEDEFATVLRDADVCVNPQPSEHKFADSSFPSKVVNYLTHGKIVISSRTPSLVKSRYSDMVLFYDDEDDKSLQAVLGQIVRDRDALRAKAKGHPWRVREIKEAEKVDVLQVLQCVSDVPR